MCRCRNGVEQTTRACEGGNTTSVTKHSLGAADFLRHRATPVLIRQVFSVSLMSFVFVAALRLSHVDHDGTQLVVPTLTRDSYNFHAEDVAICHS